MMMKRFILILTMAMFFSLAAPLTLAAYTYSDTEIEIKQTVNFREQPSTNGKRIRYLQRGEKLEIIDIPNTYWYEVRDSSGKLGFVSSSSTYIQLTTSIIQAESNGTIVSSVSFRTGPSTSNARIRYLSKGEQIRILEKVNAYWYKAEDNKHTIGYLSTNDKYIRTTWNEDQIDDGASTGQLPNAKAISSVSFRQGPSTSANRIRYLKVGEAFHIISKYNSYWYEIKDLNGTMGYVSTNSIYVSTTFREEVPAHTPNAIESIINAGIRYLGTPYEYGSSRANTSTFDCSDFIRQIFLDGINLRLPSDSRQQGDWVRTNSGSQLKTSWQQLKRGDLMFFMSYQGNDSAAYTAAIKSTAVITHVGIYLGDNKVLHTYSAQAGGVVINEIQGTHWENRFLFGGSAIPQ